MARTQLLMDWAIEEFGVDDCPSYTTILHYAKNNMIDPPAKKAGRYWRVDKGARYIGLSCKPVTKKNDDPRLLRILNDGQAS